MGIKELIDKINNCVDELDLVSARVYIEENLEILQKYRNLLKGNARDLLTFLTSRAKAGYEPFSRADMATIQAINTYSTNFDMRALKVTIKGKEQLLLRKDIVDYLNADAKVILKGMGAI